ncbi:MAG: DUF3568 family protein [Limisphaerales bacterium]
MNLRTFESIAPLFRQFLAPDGGGRNLPPSSDPARDLTFARGDASGPGRSCPVRAGFKILLLALCSIWLSGCAVLLVGGAVAAGAAAGVGATAYAKGELSSVEHVTLDQAWKAVPAAMKDFGVVVVDKGKDGLSGKVEGRAEGDKKIIVKLKTVGKGETEVRIRVGTFGDEVISRQILEGIRKHCPSASSQLSPGPGRGV